MNQALIIVFLILVIACLCNVTYQNLYCETPLDRVDFLSPQPCEPSDQLQAEIDEWQRLAQECPAR